MATNGAGSSGEESRRHRIAAFRAELAELAREGVLVLADEECVRLDAHQEAVLKTLAERGGADGRRDLSLGLRIAALLGAVALAVSAILIVRRFWGVLPAPALAAVLAGLPVLGCLGTDFVASRFKTGYLTSLAALVTLAWLVFDLLKLGDLFSAVPSPHLFLAWGAFALTLASIHRLRLLLALGLGSTAVWLAALTVAASGSPWTLVNQRLESFLPVGALLLAVSFLLPQEIRRRNHSFLPVVRLAGLLAILVPIFFLGLGSGSFLLVREGMLKSAYGGAGLVLSAAAVAAGYRWRWREMVNVGSASFALFLWTNLYDWLRDWIPTYFLLLLFALLAAASLWALQRLRLLVPAEPAAEEASA